MFVRNIDKLEAYPTSVDHNAPRDGRSTALLIRAPFDSRGIDLVRANQKERE